AFAFQRLRQLFAERAVALEMPLAAHRGALALATFRVQQHPDAPARRACALAGIMLRKTAREVAGPADIGQVAVFGAGAENVDEAVHASYRGWRSNRAGQRSAVQRLSNEPAGTTGCAPCNIPLLFAGGGDE